MKYRSTIISFSALGHHQTYKSSEMVTVSLFYMVIVFLSAKKHYVLRKMQHRTGPAENLTWGPNYRG